jgi:outer membrane protein assembly factor BamB
MFNMSIGIVLSAIIVAAANSPSSMFRADAAHSGAYDSPAPALKAVKWRFKTKGRIFSSPTVAGGTVYVGSTDGNLYAVRASDGIKLWSFATKGAVNSTPAVGNGVVYFSSLDGNVYAVDAVSGSQKWFFATQGERRFTAPGIHGIAPASEIMPDPFDMFLSAPAIDNGIVYVGSGDGNVYALDAQAGTLKWRFTTGNVVHASPAVANGAVYVGSWDRYFYALDSRTGALRWKFLTGDDTKIYNQLGIAGSATVSGNSVYFGCRDSHLYALDATTGAVRWIHDDRPSWVIGTPAVVGDSVVFTTSDEKKFYAVDVATGKDRFSVPYRMFSFSSPSVARGIAYFGSFDGRLYGVDVQTGKIVGTFATDASARNLAAHLSPDGSLDPNTFRFGPTLDGTIVGLNDVYDQLGSIVGSPSIDNGVLYIGSAEGILYAVD